MLKTEGIYWKPIQSGANEGTDLETVKQLTRLAPSHFHPSFHTFKAPLSPHTAAALENKYITVADIIKPLCPKPLIIEGAGGVLVPLNHCELMIDLIHAVDLPVIVVASSQLGTINHTLLTLQALRQKECMIEGVILNGPINKENRDSIRHHGQVKILGEVPPLTTLTKETLKDVLKNDHWKNNF